MTWIPELSVLVVKEALPLLSRSRGLPCCMLSMKKVIFPVGLSVDVSAEVTVVVNVTGAPKVDGALDESMAMFTGPVSTRKGMGFAAVAGAGSEAWKVASPL